MTRIALLFMLLITPVTALAAVAQIVVPVTITYQGRSVTARMAVDTGATVTTIDAKLAHRLGVPMGCDVRQIEGGAEVFDCAPHGLAQMADGRSVTYYFATMDLAASTMVRKGIQVNIMDYSANREADGMLGLNFLSGMTMTLDWKHRRIYWSE